MSSGANELMRRQKLLATEKDLARKTSRKLAKQAVLFSSAKIRNKYDGKNGRKKRGTSLPNTPRKRTNNRKCHTELKRRRAAQLALAHLQRSNRSLSIALSGPMGIGNDGRTPSPYSKENGLLSANCTSLALKEMREALRKRRGESAYDINNIVIPYSMAASTRVEKLKYKEIVTPKWRDVTLDPDKLAVDVPDEDTFERHPRETIELDVDKSDNSCLVQPVTEEDEEVEDLCDEIFIERHLKCEVQEKKRFMSHVHKNKRNRPKRSDGLSSTSDPLSPDAVFTNETRLANVDPFAPVLPSLAAPMSTSTTPLVSMIAQPSTTTMPITGKMHPPKDELNRRRSSSVSSSRWSSTFDENSRESLGDSYILRSPIYESWSPRIFPLTEEEYEEMLSIQPPASIIIPVCNACSLPQVPQAEILTPSSSHPCSPMPSTSSGSLIGDDPNDPEWTVIEEKAPQKQQLSVVLKLAKR